MLGHVRERLRNGVEDPVDAGARRRHRQHRGERDEADQQRVLERSWPESSRTNGRMRAIIPIAVLPQSCVANCDLALVLIAGRTMKGATAVPWLQAGGGGSA